jgi:hypothetical protein
MKRIIPAACLAVVFAVGVSAQNPPQTAPPSTPQTQPPAQEARTAAKSVTVTGCLKSGEMAESYVLSNLKFDNKDRPVGTSGTEAPPVAPNATLKVIGSPAGAKLSEHVGHTVEATGTLADIKSSGEPKPGDPKHSLDVRTLKMISTSCTP